MEDNELDPLAVEQTEQLVNEFDQQQIESEATAQAKDTEQAQETQALSEQNDPRNAERWGLNAYVKEAQSILSGGLQDTASSVATFPERTIDAISGEMQKERKEKGYYEPEWQPFKSYEDPIVTKTWWGKLLRGAVHFGSLAAAIIPTAKVTAARVGLTSTGLMANSLVRAMGVGAVSDVISKESDGDNALGMLRDHYGFVDTPISTRETDHPIMMKVKNVIEGMGIGLAFDGLSMALGRGSDAAKLQIEARRKSVDVQTLRKGIQELRSNEFRASKNKPIADAHQGAHISEEDPFIVWSKQKRIRNDWGAEDGSTGAVTTPVQRERVAREADISEDTVDDVLKKLLSSERYQKVLDSVGGSRKRLVEVFGDSIEAHQRITQGRNAAEMSSEEYLKELFESFDIYDSGTDDAIKTFTSKNVVVSDLIVGTLLHQLRDLGIAGREISDWADLGNGASQPPLLSDVLTSWNVGTSTANVFTFNATGLNLINTTDTFQISICHKFWYDFSVTTHPFAHGNNSPGGDNEFSTQAGAYYGMGDDATYKPFITTSGPAGLSFKINTGAKIQVSSGKFLID